MSTLAASTGTGATGADEMQSSSTASTANNSLKSKCLVATGGGGAEDDAEDDSVSEEARLSVAADASPSEYPELLTDELASCRRWRRCRWRLGRGTVTGLADSEDADEAEDEDEDESYASESESVQSVSDSLSAELLLFRW